jgi:hypothetical protein
MFIAAMGLFMFIVMVDTAVKSNIRSGIEWFAMAATVLTILMCSAGYIALVTIASQESRECRLLVRFVPFYAVYYALTRRGSALAWGKLAAVGAILTALSTGLLGREKSKHAPITPRRPGASGPVVAGRGLESRPGSARTGSPVGPVARADKDGAGWDSAQPVVPGPPAQGPSSAGSPQGVIRLTLSNGRVTSGRARSLSPIGLTFQVDYKVEGGPSFFGRAGYFWVIRSRHGMAGDPMPMRLNGEGTLTGSVATMTRDDGPFESHVEMGTPGRFGQRRKVSDSVPLTWVDPPASAQAGRAGAPRFPRPPLGPRR